MKTSRLDSFHRIAPRFRAALDLVATILVLVAAVTVISLAIRNWSTPPVSTRAAAPSIKLPDQPQALDGGAYLGNSKAKVALIIYSDFQCPYCERFSKETWPVIRKNYVDSGKVKAVFRHLPLTMHAFARTAALGAECARSQGKFWEMHDLLFARQQSLSEQMIRQVVKDVGLDERIFDQCVKTQASVVVDRDLAMAKALGINATPSFLIGRILDDNTVKVTNVVSGARDVTEFNSAFDSLLSNAAS